MWSNYHEYLEFKALRQRIEKRLGGGVLLTLHVLLFLVGVGSMLWYRIREMLVQETTITYFLEAGIGYVFMAWVALLALHAGVVYWRSGLAASRRDSVIENELRARLEQGDTHLPDDSRELFRLHQLLDDSIQRRAGAVFPVILYVWVLIPLWFVSGITGDLAQSSFTWMISPMLTVPFIIWLLIARWRRGSYDNRHLRNLSRYESYETLNKRKHDDAPLRLSDDGELIEFPDHNDQTVGKPKVQHG